MAPGNPLLVPLLALLQHHVHMIQHLPAIIVAALIITAVILIGLYA